MCYCEAEGTVKKETECAPNASTVEEDLRSTTSLGYVEWEPDMVRRRRKNEEWVGGAYSAWGVLVVGSPARYWD